MGERGSFSWILFPFVKTKTKTRLTPVPKPIPHSQGQKAASERPDSSPLGISGPGQLQPFALTRRGCFSWQSGLGMSLPGPPEAWEHPPPPRKGNAVSAGLRGVPPPPTGVLILPPRGQQESYCTSSWGTWGWLAEGTFPGLGPPSICLGPEHE